MIDGFHARDTLHHIGNVLMNIGRPVRSMYFADRAVVVVNPEVSSVRDSDRILGLLSSKTRRAELGNGAIEQHCC